jgi:large subunit ribosomal protein L24
MKIKTGDTVQIMAGKDRGKKANVLRAHPAIDKLTVEGVNISKRHQRPTRQGQKGTIIEKPQPINVASALLFCAKCNKGVRVSIKRTNGKRVRVCAKCDSEL